MLMGHIYIYRSSGDTAGIHEENFPFTHSFPRIIVSDNTKKENS